MGFLNESQKKAVSAGDGHTLVLAGAGSGKTRVIIERLVWLIEERGVDPRHLLALTFTNKAANEMRERVLKRIGLDRSGLWVGTFHSFGALFLRREIEVLGRSKTFTIYDEDDQLSLVKKLTKDLPSHFERISPRTFLDWAGKYKNDVREPELSGEAESDEEETCRALWVRYQNALVNASAVDFDDLLYLTARILKTHVGLQEKYQRRYRHILIDEYQDTNHAQYVIARQMAGERGNVFAVGDEDQSIYSWRGARIGNILGFEKEFLGAQVLRLEQNYRSTESILQVANSVVRNNKHRLGKTLWTVTKGGPPVRVFREDDNAEEARHVVDDISDNGRDGTTAILYRAHWQCRLFEEQLRIHGLAYRIIGGMRFYERKEVKDLVCYMRLLVNPGDDVSVRRVINVPRRGLGDATLTNLGEMATERGQSLFSVLREIEHDQSLTPRTRASIAEFIHLIDDLTYASRDLPVAKLVTTLLDRINYRDHVSKSDEKDMRDRMEIVDEFVSACESFDERREARGSDGQPIAPVLEFLQELSLFAETDAADSNITPVTLMTIHAAKGLEFDSVYLTGLEEGLLPHAASSESEDGLEEERRLCYVAMTRARKRLTLSFSDRRLVYGEWRDCEISRFVREIPDSFVEFIRSEPAISKSARDGRNPFGGGARRTGGMQTGRGFTSRETSSTPARPAAKQATNPADVLLSPVSSSKKPAPPVASSGVKELFIGAKVRHARFGPGSVVSLSGEGDSQKVRIRFQSGRMSLFLVKMTPLEIL
jgi:DNA helicase-2/ATP-dependent DNA helicase PcrA